MSFEDRVSAFNMLVQSSFRNAMDSVESIHQTTAEMPLDMLVEYGYPEDKAEAAKESHRQLLGIVYGGICSANEELGNLPEALRERLVDDRESATSCERLVVLTMRAGMQRPEDTGAAFGEGFRDGLEVRPMVRPGHETVLGEGRHRHDEEGPLVIAAVLGQEIAPDQLTARIGPVQPVAPKLSSIGPRGC